MKITKLKMILIMLTIAILIVCIPGCCYGTNENLVIVENNQNEYLIYLKSYLDEEFEFAFSNDKAVIPNDSDFINSALDSTEADANNIAYVDSTTKAMFENTTYMWVKTNENTEISALEIDIKDNITKTELENVGKTSTIIPIKLGQEEIVNEVNEEGTKITEKVGIVEIQKEVINGKYQLVKREMSEKNDKLFALAELIEKNEFTDSYTKIKASKEFIALGEDIFNTLNSNEWRNIDNSKIQQPSEAENGDQYILWLKGDNIQDIHFLTSYREYKEEFIKEEIKTKLPYTYDNNTVLILLGIVIIAIIVVAVRIAILKKKEMKQ